MNGVRINTNVSSLRAARSLSQSAEGKQKTFERLASGRRINHAADDAAGLSISDHMRAEIRSLGQAERNTMDGVSMIQVAEGGLSEISNMLIRIRELSIQGASDTIGNKERIMIHREVDQLKKEIDRIAQTTSYNGTDLLNGKEKALVFQVGSKNGEVSRIVFDPKDHSQSTRALGISSAATLSKGLSRVTIDMVDHALNEVNKSRSKLGAIQNRLQSTDRNLLNYRENMSASKSRILDTDYASEISQQTKLDILEKSNVSVLMSANFAPQQITKLLVSSTN